MWIPRKGADLTADQPPVLPNETFIHGLDVRPHGAQNPDHTISGRVDTDVLQDEIRTLGDGCANQKESRRGDIGRYVDIGTDQSAAALKTDDTIGHLHRITKSSQHSLCMVPVGAGSVTLVGRWRRASQQDAGLHLSARDRQVIVKSSQRAASRISSGGQPSRELIRAPICDNGVITRAIGRRSSDLSPVMMLSKA
ncbi:MAG: hypothetical protein CM15mP74_02650 [Halieaceae bacterium]|nr:MAG: hypothetical protein CM15mP74_02650 [Halieaceae bacterium]